MLWLDVFRILPMHIPEYARQLTPVYDPINDTFTSQPDIDTRPYDYGGVGGVRYLNGLGKNISGYFSVLLKAMEKEGYVAGQTVFGAPFDWRLANAKQILTNGMAESLKELVEHASFVNQGKKVHLVGHSMGATFIHQFLMHFVSEEWKNRYVESFISINGPYGGSFEAFAHLASPHRWGSSPVSAKLLHKITQTLGGIYWMLPNSNAFAKDKVIAKVPNANMVITLDNMTSTWSVSNRSTILRAVESTLQATTGLDALHLPTHIFYSNGYRTMNELVFEGPEDSWWTKESKSTSTTDGDGTVPIESLKSPLRWKDEQIEIVTEHLIEHASHISVLHKPQLVAEVMDIILETLKKKDKNF